MDRNLFVINNTLINVIDKLNQAQNTYKLCDLKQKVMSVLLKHFICTKPSIIANRYGVDYMLQNFGVKSNLQHIQQNQYILCDICDSRLIYQNDKYALYCKKCGIMKYEGYFVIDKAINPYTQQNHYTQMDTYFNWVESLLNYKNNIPDNIYNKIMAEYNKYPNHNNADFGDAARFEEILSRL